MLKDVKYKYKVFIFYTDEFSRPTDDINKNMVVQKMKIGILECKEENIRSYVVVQPEYYLWHPVNTEKQITMKIVWKGAYFINKDRNLINEQDIYDCWIDTAKEIIEFISRNDFGNLQTEYPSFQSVQSELLQFVRSLQSAN